MFMKLHTHTIILYVNTFHQIKKKTLFFYDESELFINDVIATLIIIKTRNTLPYDNLTII